MNENIEKLLKEVWPDPETSHVNHLKFAELIVRECVDFCANVCLERIQGDCPKDSREDNEARRCANAIRSQAMQHFGIV